MADVPPVDRSNLCTTNGKPVEYAGADEALARRTRQRGGAGWFYRDIRAIEPVKKETRT